MRTRVAVVALAAALAAASSQAQPLDYSVHDLGRLPGAFTTQPMAINDNGEVVGYTQGPFTQLRAFVWRSGQGLVEIPPPPGYNESQATDISDNGIIVGAAKNGLEGLPRAWRLTGGKYFLLPETLDGCGHLFPNAVNNDGTMVGITMSSNAGLCPSKGWYYSDATGLIDLTALFNAQDAQDVNNQGVATGEGFDGAYKYAPGAGYQVIGVLPGYEDGAQGNAINDLGEVVGFSVDAVPSSPDPWQAFLHTNGAMVDITSTTLAKSAAWDVNERTDVIGNDGTLSTPEQYLWIWSPAEGKRLVTDNVASPNGFVSIRGARGIDNSRRIVTKAVKSDPTDGYGYGVILVPGNLPPPIPPPSAGLPTGGGLRTRK